MGFDAKIILDSISPNEVRLTTMEVTFPRIVLAEFNTHRMFSRNSASSRAIPIAKMIKRVEEDPFIPEYWGKNQKGMQAEQELGEHEARCAEGEWKRALDSAIFRARALSDIGVHKQLANRLLEPFMFHTVLVTATEWDNFFALRCHKDAQPEIRKIAVMMREKLEASTPKFVDYGEWHLPLMEDVETLSKAPYNFGDEQLIHICSGRCARISYLTHHGVRDPNEDIRLFSDLSNDGHMSPLEHPATPSIHNKFIGNFKGWVQYRKTIPNEANFGAK